MGRYTRKSNRHSWDESSMKNAISAVKSGEMGWLLASKTFGVPFGTLRRRAAKNDWSKGYLGGYKTTFNKKLEEEIVLHIKNLESRFFGLSTIDVRKLAYQIAESKGLKHRFSKVTNMAGWDWLHAFRQRNPSLSLRTPESTSAARACAFNKPQIEKYFKLLDTVLQEHNIKPKNIYNVDEAGLTTVPSKNIKILATRGRKQVGILSSAERGQHFTIVCCMNAEGNFVPPSIIFPRKNMKNELMDGAPVGSVAFCSETGWMNGDLFLKWMKYFVKRVQPSQEQKVLLLLDGHSSHKNLEVLRYAKLNNVIIFCLPPHCTHRAQPLDVSFYSPLTTYYNQELSLWIRNHPGRIVTHYQVAQLFNNAYVKAATLKNAQSGFSATGIFPFNPNIFPEWMFDPALVTDQPATASENIIPPALPATSQIYSSPTDNNPEEATEQPVTISENIIQPALPSTSQTCSSSSPANCNPAEVSDQPTTASKNIIQSPLPSTTQTWSSSSSDNCNKSVAEILPLPLSSQGNSRPKRRKGSFGFLNSTPELESAKAIVAEKDAAVRRKDTKSVKRQLVPVKDTKVVQPLRQSSRSIKKVYRDEDDSSDVEDVEDIEEEEDIPCLYCNEIYQWSRSKEMWFKCQCCNKWAHAECAGLTKKSKTFICELCS